MAHDQKDLLDELARVRAREKRFKDSAEAQIASLREQLEYMTAAKNEAEAARNELENRCRQLEEEVQRHNARETREDTSKNSPPDDRPFYEILRDFF